MKAEAILLLRALGRNLLSGLRLALFLPVGRYDFRVSPADFALLCAFNLLAWLAGGMLRGGFPGYVDFAALPVALAEIPLLLLAGAIVARWYRRRELLLALALMLIAPDALVELAASALVIALRFGHANLDYSAQWALYLGYLAWLFAIALRALWVAAGWRLRPFLQSSALLAALFLFMVDFMPHGELWVPYGEDVAARPSIVQEELFHAQDGLLDARLDGLQPQRPGVTDLYFVGFAPDGNEDVFGRELGTVSRLMRDRFDAAGRTLLLGNDPATLADLPLADATNLRIALERIGAIMDPDEDVLFLYITTHGSEDGALAVDLPPLELNQIRPAALARMLHDSGVKWKVLVVSACYSGRFIEPFKDDNTLIITATDARSQSFGCGNGQKFTWFGKAYFDDALRHTRSFTDAFAFARKEVARREREQRYTPSNPQMYIGAAMRAKLHALEARLMTLR